MPPVQVGRQGVLCPVCHSHSRVLRTEPYGRVSIRMRMCKNDKCRETFQTKETIVTDEQQADLYDDE